MSDYFEIKPDGSWVFHGEDSRLRDRTRNQKEFTIWNPSTRRMERRWGDHCYCYNCGADGGYSARESPCVKFICDKCATLPCWNGRFIPMLPEEEWCWRNGLPPPKK